MRKLPSVLGVAVVAAVACSDAFQPTIESVSGLYTTQTFTTDSAGTTKDWVAAGATLDLALIPSGVVSGQLTMPGVPSDTVIFIALMEGTWSLTGKTVHFSQNADTFVRDMDWVVGTNRLSGDKTFGDVRVRIMLIK